MSRSPATPAAAPQRLLDQLRHAALERFGRPEPGERFAAWCRRYILFQGTRHPRELGPNDAARFFQQLIRSEKDPVAAVEQAHEALQFL
jgi:hypothetical protein